MEEVRYQRVANNNETAAGGFRYTYDDVGNITEIADANDACLVSYVYDELYQLVEEHDFVRGVDVYYTYDDAGNLLSKSTEDSWGPLGTQTYAYNDSVWGDLLTSFNNQPITYDTIGNPLSYRGWTMSWEAGRQLAGMTKGTDALSFKYNVAGLRTEKTVNGVTTKYYWDGDRLIYQTDGTNTMRFYYDANGELTSLWDSADGTCYVIKDAQGNVIRLVGMYGQTVAEYTYDAWGNILSAPTTGAGARNSFRYRACACSAESETHNYPYNALKIK